MRPDDEGANPPRPVTGRMAAGEPDSGRLMILPEGPGDGARAVRELERALETPEVAIMLVLGDDERAARIVGWARPLCGGTGVSPRGPERRVIWIRRPEVPEIGVFLAMLLWLPLPQVAVLNSRKWVRVRIAEQEEIDAGVLERAFQRGERREPIRHGGGGR
jgi:hypothetical protein